MGLDSIWHWAILLVVVLVIFGTGKLTKIGPDLGNAVRGFKKAMQGDEDEEKRKAQEKLQADPSNANSGTQANQNQRDSSESK
ncbi:Sec-independent protein translocase subunit TatA [Dyella mobilis]|uniref:Sec-independent protein translocase protein TatA n=1 Tax=Dyella mobilis TaxID=1849582 RepID=A0ABS2KCP4_9GAMM|nr:Sec-independent protein translocase subunit TatA [Dyella mobilis]MBM7128590.1 Sec-independent protein translocase subunit TatA [Dyella mobilis]GLQ99506.1 Sec-independent protein translocase protein TatA [Dyella mobilis]